MFLFHSGDLGFYYPPNPGHDFQHEGWQAASVQAVKDFKVMTDSRDLWTNCQTKGRLAFRARGIFRSDAVHRRLTLTERSQRGIVEWGQKWLPANWLQCSWLAVNAFQRSRVGSGLWHYITARLSPQPLTVQGQRLWILNMQVRFPWHRPPVVQLSKCCGRKTDPGQLAARPMRSSYLHPAAGWGSFNAHRSAFCQADEHNDFFQVCRQEYSTVSNNGDWCVSLPCCPHLSVKNPSHWM